MDPETKEDKNNALKIILIVVGVLVFGSVAFLIGLNFSDRGNGGGVTNKFFTENGMRERGRTNDNQAGNGGERLFLGLSLNGGTNGSGKLKSNFLINPDGESVVTFYDDYGFKTSEFRGTFANDGTSEGVIITYDDDGNVNQSANGTFKGSFTVEDGKLNGKGRITFYHKNGNRRVDLKGHFERNELKGEGEIIFYYENGNKHIEARGNIKGWELHGEGVAIHHWESGRKKREYRGNFKDNELHGEGVVKNYDGDGNYKEGLAGTFKYGIIQDGDNNGNAPSPAPTPSPEPPSTAQVSIDDDAFLGNRNAPVTIVEFSDYSCSFCGRFYSQTLPSIKSKYIETGKVKFVYRDFPVLGATGQAAAEASECVREMGGDEAFWKYHDTIFENQPMLSGGREKLLEWASEMGHDIEDCLDSNKFAGEVQKDMADGRKIGITGTPGFVIGKTDGDLVRGPVVRGAYPFTAFEQIIDAELR